MGLFPRAFSRKKMTMKGGERLRKSIISRRDIRKKKRKGREQSSDKEGGTKHKRMLPECSWYEGGTPGRKGGGVFFLGGEGLRKSLVRGIYFYITKGVRITMGIWCRDTPIKKQSLRTLTMSVR